MFLSVTGSEIYFQERNMLLDSGNLNKAREQNRRTARFCDDTVHQALVSACNRGGTHKYRLLSDKKQITYTHTKHLNTSAHISTHKGRDSTQQEVC